MNRLGSTAARLKLKEIDGDSHKRRSMRFNSMVREKPYQGLKCQWKLAGNGGCLSRTADTGAAWLPSARGLNCSLKWGNERNPCHVLQVSRETAVFYTEEGEDDVKSAWPSDALGYTHATMDETTGREAARRN